MLLAVQTMTMVAVSEEVQTSIDAVKARMEQLVEVAVQYHDALVQTMAHHEHVVEVTKTYNSKATDFMFACDDVEQEIQQPTMYQSVQEVQTAISDLNGNLRQVCVAAAARASDWRACRV